MPERGDAGLSTVARPVFVWLHGGGFTIGHAGASLYGRRAPRRWLPDAVVVSVNYRLGSLGWLGHPDLAAGPQAPAANWGLLDMIAALGLGARQHHGVRR